MSLFSRMLHKRKTVPAIVTPDDGHLAEKLDAAKKENKDATTSFAKAAEKQYKDAVMARRVINEILDRADRIKAMNHANSTE